MRLLITYFIIYKKVILTIYSFLAYVKILFVSAFPHSVQIHTNIHMQVYYVGREGG